jgi:hypothetical protein
MRQLVAIALPILTFGACVSRATATPMPDQCPPDRAIYEAALVAPNSQPDELRFRFDSSALVLAVVKSFQRDFEIGLEAGMTNSSGVVFVSGEIPFEKLPSYMQEQQRAEYERSLRTQEANPRGPRRKNLGPGEPPLILTSIAVSVYSDFGVGSLPVENGPAPVVVIFPEFRRLAHISTFDAVGHGIAGGTFRFARCEPKRE